MRALILGFASMFSNKTSEQTDTPTLQFPPSKQIGARPELHNQVMYKRQRLPHSANILTPENKMCDISMRGTLGRSKGLRYVYATGL